jgi:hypothetical protein
MTDRELLEAAAKAAGIEVDCWLDEDPRAVTSVGLWNPLVNSGDAFELYVKLRLWVGQHEDGVTVSDLYARFTVIEEDHGTDGLAATRRAIVRAAAAIGKEMKDD